MKNLTTFVLSIVLAIALFLSSCEPEKQRRLKIAISKEKSVASTTKYADWLLRHSENIDNFILYPMGIDSALEMLSTCDGLLLTGGEDVFPGNYGKIDDTSRCGSFDTYRDSLEFALIEMAIEYGIPIFGVCRGEQILNISQGGTLYIDIPTDFDSTIAHRQPDWGRGYHPVRLVKGSLLQKICDETKQGDVVSSHHQGIEILGEGLVISSYSSDSLPEAIEWSDTLVHPYLMAVQWHPEAMDTLDPLSAPLARKFLQEAAEYSMAE